METLSRKQIEMANVREYLSVLKANKILMDDMALIVNPWTEKFAIRYALKEKYRKQFNTLDFKEAVLS